MFLRALAILAALAVPLLMTIDPVTAPLSGMLWIGSVIAAACAVPIIVVAKEHRGQAILGAALAAMAAGLSPDVPELLALTGDEDSMPVQDLRVSPLPRSRAHSRDYVAVRGYVRREWMVDEYGVAEGERPDQNEAARAVLLPLLGTRDDAVVDRGGVVVVARVSPERVEQGDLQTLTGRLGPVSDEIRDALFMVQGGEAGDADVPVVMLDTLDVPTRGQAWTRTGLAIGAALLALVVLLTALPSRTEREAPPAD